MKMIMVLYIHPNQLTTCTIFSVYYPIICNVMATPILTIYILFKFHPLSTTYPCKLCATIYTNVLESHFTGYILSIYRVCETCSEKLCKLKRIQVSDEKQSPKVDSILVHRFNRLSDIGRTITLDYICLLIPNTLYDS